MRKALVGVVVFGASLACSGLPTSVPGPDAPEEPEEGAAGAVDELVDAEEPMRGDPPPAPGDRELRLRAVEAFIAATPDFEEWRPVVLDLLRSDQVDKTEQAYDKAKADFAPKPPPVATVTTDAWKVGVVVSHAYTRSDDWGAFTHEVSQALAADGVVMVDSGPGEDAVKVERDGKEVATIDLTPFLEDRTVLGYVFARAGADPTFQAHAPPSEVTSAARTYFSGQAPAEGGEEGEGGEGGEEADPGRTKAKYKAKAKSPPGGQP